MSKILNHKNDFIFENNDLCDSGIVLDYFKQNRIDVTIWDRLSDLVKTMTGDAITSFNTIYGMIQQIPGIEECREETSVLCVWGLSVEYFILGWDYEENTELWDKILRSQFPNLQLQSV